MQLEVSDLFFSYDETDVLKSVSFCADRGERIAVLGPNGVGKSTLFRCLLGFLEPKRGSVKIAGRDVRDYSRRALAAELAYIPQSYSPAFDHTVLDSVLMGLGVQLGPFDRPSREQTDAALRILDELGIGALASRGCMRISGGERQLMLLGRALIQNAHTLIMGQPRLRQQLPRHAAHRIPVGERLQRHFFHTRAESGIPVRNEGTCPEGRAGAGFRPAGAGADPDASADALWCSGCRHAGAGRKPSLFCLYALCNR